MLICAEFYRPAVVLASEIVQCTFVDVHEEVLDDGNMEKTYRIALDDAFAAYGRLNFQDDAPLFIMVHGLPCSIYDSFCASATDWFAKRGFSTFRFNLYGYEKDARQLIDCTLNIHAADLDAIVQHFRKRGVKKIYVAGHSFGGPTILQSLHQNFDAVTLWDPSYKISFVHENYGFPGGKYVKSINGYLMRWGANTIIGKKMADEVEALNWDDLTTHFKRPLKIIAAGKGVLVPGSKQHFKHAHDPKELTIMKDATHYFDDAAGLQEEVFTQSKHWFEKF